MPNKNICKFITETSRDKLEIHSFIYETDKKIITSKKTLTYHRCILVKFGRGTITIDGKVFDFSTGSLIFAFSGEKIVIEPGDKCELMYIVFEGARSGILFSRFGITKFSRLYNSFDGLIPLWYDSLCRASDANLDLVSESILLYTFSRFKRDTDKNNSLINKILEITEEMFTEPSLSISTIANDLSYNPKYISHLFKKKMGVGYSEYLCNIRIKYAVSLLEYGIDSIKNTAYLSGFSDPLYFSTVFKKNVGVSPKEYASRLK